MTWTQNLGRVKGQRGALLVPQITQTAQGIKISWSPSDNEYDGPIPDEVLFEPIYYIPYVEETVNDNGDTVQMLKWTHNKNNQDGAQNIPIPQPINIKGDKGERGNAQLEIEVVTYTASDDISNPKAFLKNKYVTNASTPLQTENKFFILNDEVWAYDRDTNEFYYIEKAIDLSSYYTIVNAQNDFYLKTDIDAKLGTIAEMQTTIINMLDTEFEEIPNNG